MANRICVVVDDEASVRSFMGAVLRRDGFEILPLSNGSEALHAIQELDGAVDIVVSDVCMGDGINGITLMQSLKKSYPSLPVILVSGFSDQHIPEGPPKVAFLRKPFAIDTLLHTVKQVLAE